MVGAIVSIKAKKTKKKVDNEVDLPYDFGDKNVLFVDDRFDDYVMVNGKRLLSLEKSIPNVKKNGYFSFCVPAYVIDAKEFTFQKSKKAFKMTLDFDGILEERVLWPDYNTGKLGYPEGIKKGAVILLYVTIDAKRSKTYIKQMHLISAT